jgi:hypothetical protein
LLLLLLLFLLLLLLLLLLLCRLTWFVWAAAEWAASSGP